MVTGLADKTDQSAAVLSVPTDGWALLLLAWNAYQ